MKMTIVLLSSILTAAAMGPAYADSTGAQGVTPGTAAGQETSDRTPNKATKTPESQVTKTEDNETSSRTPNAQNESDRGEAATNGASSGSSGDQK